MEENEKPIQIPLGGLCELGISSDGTTLLTISHSGQGIFLIPNGECVARDPNPAYPTSNESKGIEQWSNVSYKTSGLWNPIDQSLLPNLSTFAPNYDISDIRGLAMTPNNQFLVVGNPDSITIYKLASN